MILDDLMDKEILLLILWYLMVLDNKNEFLIKVNKEIVL